MKQIGYIGGIVCVGLGLAGGGLLSYHLNKPTVAVTMDLDGDGIPDLVLKSRVGDVSYLLAEVGGIYRNVDEMQKEGLKTIESEIEAKRKEEIKMFRDGWNKTKKTIEEKLKTIP